MVACGSGCGVVQEWHEGGREIEMRVGCNAENGLEARGGWKWCGQAGRNQRRGGGLGLACGGYDVRS